MSYFIANTLNYNVEEDKIYVRGGSNNVVPRSNNWDYYSDKKDLLVDLISGGLDLRCSNKLSLACLSAIEDIKKMHRDQFGQRQKELGGTECINAYSLYMIKGYARWDKEETIKNTRENISMFIDSYQKERIKEAEIMETIWDEAVEFYKKVESYFFNKIGINI